MVRVGGGVDKMDKVIKCIYIVNTPGTTNIPYTHTKFYFCQTVLSKFKAPDATSVVSSEGVSTIPTSTFNKLAISDTVTGVM
jgi:hypothetical protein